MRRPGSRAARRRAAALFGPSVSVASDATPGAWLDEARGPFGTVGGLVPDRFEAVARLAAPDPNESSWWDQYRAQVRDLAEIAERHTGTPESANFAVWEGYGFATATTWYTRSDAGRVRRAITDAHIARRQRHHARVRRALRSQLDALVSMDRPQRSYFLLRGPVGAAADIETPGNPASWQRSDLWWPDDRSWFVATDVDFWAHYIAGTRAFIDEITAGSTAEITLVTRSERLRSED